MIKVGIIGCGSITVHRHAPEYAENKLVKLAGFYDYKVERAQELSRKYGGKVYSTYEELIEDPEIDAVSVCTANAFHAPVTIAALKSGKHVLCEKPMATSLEDGEAMVKAAEESGKFLMTGHNQRLVAAHIRAKQIIKSRELGRIISFKTNFSHCGPEMWSADKSANTWFFDKQASFVGVMGDLGIHKVDLVRWLIDDEIDEVMAYTATLDKRDGSGKLIEVCDTAKCILKSKKGIIGTLDCSWTNYGEEDNSTEIYMTGGVMRIFDDPVHPVVVTYKNGEKAFYKVGKIQTNTDQSKSGVIDAFVNSINSCNEPEISGKEGLAALKVIFACMESSEKKIAIKIS